MRTWVYAVAGLAFGAVIIAISESAPAPQPTSPEDIAKAAADRAAGFHCLSAWDGSHSALIRDLRAQLRDPDSFEHIETRIAPVNAEGAHALVMQYRAANRLGGINLGTLTASVDPDTCAAVILSNVEN